MYKINIPKYFQIQQHNIDRSNNILQAQYYFISLSLAPAFFSPDFSACTYIATTVNK